MGLSLWSRSPFFSTTRFLHKLFLHLLMLAKIQNMEKLRFANNTSRLDNDTQIGFFHLWDLEQLWELQNLPWCKNISEGSLSDHWLCAVGHSGAAIQGGGDHLGYGNYQQPGFAFAGAPEAFWEFEFLLFLSNTPLGAAGNKHGRTTFCQKSPKG